MALSCMYSDWQGIIYCCRMGLCPAQMLLYVECMTSVFLNPHTTDGATWPLLMGKQQEKLCLPAQMFKIHHCTNLLIHTIAYLKYYTCGNLVDAYSRCIVITQLKQNIDSDYVQVHTHTYIR